MAGGYIEINDTNSIIRGTMAGVDGTFSGTFSSNNIDAISNVNVRDGAVSAYYHFHFDKSISDFSFSVLKQPFTSIVDIVIPVMIEEVGEGDPNASWHGGATPVYHGYMPTTVTVYKNGVLFSRKELNPNSGSFLVGINSGSQIKNKMFYHFVNYISALRIVDFNVSTNTTYRIIVNNHYGARPYWQKGVHGDMSLYENTRFYTRVDLQGQISVGFRKR